MLFGSTLFVLSLWSKAQQNIRPGYSDSCPWISRHKDCVINYSYSSHACALSFVVLDLMAFARFCEFKKIQIYNLQCRMESQEGRIDMDAIVARMNEEDAEFAAALEAEVCN